MGLTDRVLRIAVVVGMIVSTSCTARKEVVERSVNKRYIACCDPGLGADDKDLCKWLHEHNAHSLKDGAGTIHEGVWQDCKPGEEPWRKWD